MLKNKLFVIFFLVSVIDINAMQHIRKNIAEKFVKNPQNVGFWTTSILVNIPFIKDIAKLWELKKTKESKKKRWYPVVGQESKYFKRAKISPEAKRYLTENGIEANRLQMLHDEKYKNQTLQTPDGKIILSQDCVASVENLAHNIKSNEVCADIRNFFEIKKTQQSYNNKSREKQIERNPIAYLGGVLVAQAILKPLSLIKKASSLSKKSYFYNGIKGFFKASLLSHGGWIGKYLYAKHEEKKSYDIDCEPVAKNNLLEVIKEEELEAAKEYRNNQLGRVIFNLDEYANYFDHSINQQSRIVSPKINLSPEEIIATAEYYQEKNKKDHPEIFTKKN